MSANSLFSITISQLAERIESNVMMNDNFIITHNIKNCIDLLSFPLRVEAVIIAICLKGYIKASINMREWKIEENTCVASLPENVIGILDVSDDCEGSVVAISIDYLKSININLTSVLSHYIAIRNFPCMKIEEGQARILNQLYELITVTLYDPASTRKEDIVKSLFSALVFKYCDNLDENNVVVKNIKNKSKEYYFLHFLEQLSLDFRNFRSIEHYSNRLGITPKYLSALMKSISGNSAAKWINEYTIAEASILLRFSDKTIQQIADELNFPSQSFFSKYFKNKTGKSPSEYRKAVCVY